MNGVEDQVGSCNAYVMLTDRQRVTLIRNVLTQGAPGLLGVQEWAGPKPDLTDLTRRRRAIDDLLMDATSRTFYKFGRPKGGGPLVWDSSRYDLQKLYTEQLVGPGFVGHLTGRRDRLGPSLATVGVFVDEVLDEDAALVDVHLTAEVQKGKGYRTDPDHLLRVLRHRRERRALRLLVRRLRRERIRVYVTGDTNYDGMTLPPLISCWVGHPDQEAAGTLGSRTPDYVYGPQRAASVMRIPTRSDHDAVVATYRRKAA
jgi:hypothetical protein